MHDWIEAERQGSFRFCNWLDFNDAEGRRDLESWYWRKVLPDAEVGDESA